MIEILNTRKQLSQAAFEVLHRAPHQVNGQRNDKICNATYMALDRHDIQTVAELAMTKEEDLRRLLAFDFKATGRYHRHGLSHGQHADATTEALAKTKMVLADNQLSLGMKFYDRQGHKLSLRQVLEASREDLFLSKGWGRKIADGIAKISERSGREAAQRQFAASLKQAVRALGMF